MRRAHLANAKISEYKKRIAFCKQEKEKLIEFLQKLKEDCFHRRISYQEYQRIAEKKRDNKTIEEWIHYYDNYIKECLLRVAHEQKKQRNHNLLTAFYSLILASSLFLFLSYAPQLTGFIIKEQAISHTDEVNFITNTSTSFEWQPNNLGLLKAIRASGSIEGDGEVRIYIDNILVLDSAQLSEISPQVAGASALTGFAISSANADISSPSSSPNISTTEENTTIQNTGGEVSQQTESPSQEKLLPASDAIANLNATFPTESPAEQNQTLPLKKLTFTNICIESCDLKNFSLNKSSYIIRIELANARLFLDALHYDALVFPQPDLPQLEEINITNATEELLQEQAEIGKPVKWTKKISLPKPGIALIELPEQAINIKSKAIDADINITLQHKEKIGKNKIISIEYNFSQYEITYETPAPELTEKNISAKIKQITISSPENLSYINVISHTSLPNQLRPEYQKFIKLYWLVNGTKQEHPFEVNDSDSDGLIDTIQWITLHLSNQTFEIIIITKAEHLDKNREFIADIYEEVKSLDNIWSPVVSNNEYVRVTFERNLTSSNDITIFPRIKNGNPSIKVYETNKSTIIATFENLEENQYNKVFLTSLAGEQDTFDLQIEGGAVEFDHIVDPAFEGTTQGLIVYGESTVTIPRFRNWTGSDFSEEKNISDLGASSTIQWVIVKSSIQRNQTAVGILDAQGDILLSMRNATNGTYAAWLDVADIGTTNDAFRGFDIATESASGDFMAVYEKNTTADRNLNYRIWNGTGWSSESIITLNSNVAAEAQLFISLVRNPSTDEIMLATAGTADDISAARWDGSAWVNITTINVTAAAIDEERFDIAWESLSGDALIIYGGGTTNANYRIWSNTTKSWGNEVVLRNRGAVVQQVDACAESTTDYIAAILSDSGGDLLPVIWNGTTWLANEPAEELAVENVATRNVACTWTKNSSKALFAYVESNALAFRFFAFPE